MPLGRALDPPHVNRPGRVIRRRRASSVGGIGGIGGIGGRVGSPAVASSVPGVDTMPVTTFRNRHLYDWPDDLYAVPRYAFGVDASGKDRLRCPTSTPGSSRSPIRSRTTCCSSRATRTHLWELDYRLAISQLGLAEAAAVERRPSASLSADSLWPEWVLRLPPSWRASSTRSTSWWASAQFDPTEQPYALASVSGGQAPVRTLARTRGAARGGRGTAGGEVAE
jgi:hypothetical protein